MVHLSRNDYQKRKFSNFPRVPLGKFFAMMNKPGEKASFELKNTGNVA